MSINPGYFHSKIEAKEPPKKIYITTIFFDSRLFKSKRLWNVSKISVNHTDDIPYMEMFHFAASEANFSKVKSFFEIIFTLASGLFVCGWIQDVARLLRVERDKGSEYLPK